MGIICPSEIISSTGIILHYPPPQINPSHMKDRGRKEEKSVYQIRRTVLGLVSLGWIASISPPFQPQPSTCTHTPTHKPTRKKTHLQSPATNVRIISPYLDKQISAKRGSWWWVSHRNHSTSKLPPFPAGQKGDGNGAKSSVGVNTNATL